MLKLEKINWRRRLPLLVLGVAILLAAVLIMTRPRPQPVTVGERAWLVGISEVRLRTLAPHATLYGRLESLASSKLSAAVATEVKSVDVDEGDQVAAGAVLLHLDERDTRLRLAEREADIVDAEARVESEKTRYETDQKALLRERRLLQLTRDEVSRLQDLVRKKVGAQSALDTSRQAVERQAVLVAARDQSIAEHPARMAQAEAALQRAHAQRDQAKLDLERCTVRAPFAGRVAQRFVAAGQRVKVGDALITLYDNQAMVLRALIPQRYLAAVRQAQAAGQSLSVSGQLDGHAVSGRLRGLVGEVDANSGGVPALFDIHADPALLQQGRFLQVDLALPLQEEAISLPHEAVYGADKVYVVDKDSRMRQVRVERLGEMRGKNGDTRLLVRSPALQAGMQVVATQLPNAVDGLLVRVAGEERE
jgi:RND family efflux transporter MFP subunit